jgi:hypothetical protein
VECSRRKKARSLSKKPVKNSDKFLIFSFIPFSFPIADNLYYVKWKSSILNIINMLSDFVFDIDGGQLI